MKALGIALTVRSVGDSSRMEGSTPEWLSTAISEFGDSCKAKLAGPGDREAAIRSPIEALLVSAGSQLALTVVPHDEVRDTDRGVRPDYAISVNGAIAGYVEVKRPGLSVDPETFTGHDLEQWNRQRDLPNLLYTNGIEWRLWRDKVAIGEPVYLSGGDLTDAGASLDAPEEFEKLLFEFLRWKPVPITSVGALVRSIAPLTRLLRGEVLDQLAIEARRISEGADVHAQAFHGLAADWRNLLFPDASDETFADGYAQSVTFALLLARSEEIDFDSVSLHEIGARLGEGHSLMGRALQLLTDDAAADFRVTLDLLLRVTGAVSWERVRGGRRDTYLYLYEEFLEEYDASLRKASGSYYTPLLLVEEMTRLTEEVLKSKLKKTDGFLDPSVLTVDPAMGTGTYLNAIIERAAQRAVKKNGPGVGAGVVSDLAKRLVGFEIQMGPYAVAELRTTDLLRDFGATLPPGGMKAYVTNTLDDPYTEIDQIASSLQAISASRRKANEIKSSTPVTVVIGNPPYRERAEGEGGWIEHGRIAAGQSSGKKYAPLDDFRADDNGRNEYVLKNLYVYFWRWATWKVFDAQPDDSAGVVCFVTTSGYLQGRGFRGMREYLRRTADEGWIINLSPEGHQPPVATRLFPGVQQTLAIGIFVRGTNPDPESPARINYLEVSGRRNEKYEALARVGVASADWREARTDWQSSFTPAADSAWDDWPAIDDLMPWTSPGVKPNRTWIYAPSRQTLEDRWREIVAEKDPEKKRLLFQESRDANLTRTKTPLAGADSYKFDGAFERETGAPPEAVRVGYRAFDRQWVIPDARLIATERPPLWAARLPEQIFVLEQSAHPIDNGPALLFSALIPDMHAFNNRGGRTLPMLHPDGTSNSAPGFLDSMRSKLGKSREIPASEVLSYVAGVTAHGGFSETFADELSTPGVRVPLTGDQGLWDEAVALGEKLIWLHTYGARFADAGQGREPNDVRFPEGDSRQPLAQKPISRMPESLDYDETTETLSIGTGSFSPVTKAVFEYEVGNRRVIESWFNYRKANPGGRRTESTSPLAYLHPDSWPTEWTLELIDLLTVLARIVDLQEAQSGLLSRILAGPLISLDQLRDDGVLWPSDSASRKPREHEEGTFGF